MTGPIDQDHPVIFGKPVAKRLPHGLQIGAGAVDHHDRGPGGIARPDIDDVEGSTRNLDQLALRGPGTLQQDDASLCDQRQDRQRRHDACQYH